MIWLLMWLVKRRYPRGLPYYVACDLAPDGRDYWVRMCRYPDGTIFVEEDGYVEREVVAT